MRFRPANIRLINRRLKLLRLLLVLSSKKHKSNNDQTHRSRRLTGSLHIRPMRSSSRIEGDFQNLVGSSPNRTLHPFWPNFRAGGHGSRMSVQWVVTKAVDQSLWCVNVRRSVPAPQPILPAVLRRSCTATQEASRVSGSRPPGTRLRSRRLTAQAARTHIGCCGPTRLARMAPRPP